MDDGGSPTTGMKKLSNRLMKLFGVDTDDVTEEEIIWFQCNGSFDTENATLLKYSEDRF